MMKKRTKAAAAAAMALVMLGGVLPAVPGGAELLKAPLTAHAAGSVTLDWETGVLTLSGAVTKEQIWEYREPKYVYDYMGDIEHRYTTWPVKSIVAEEGCVFPADCSELFCKGKYYFDLDEEDKFDYWGGVTKIDLSKADTSHVTDMHGMFSVTDWGEPVQSHLWYALLGLDHFDTSSVTNMNSMFKGSTFRSLDLSNFNTSNVTDMSGMFYHCDTLTSLNVSSFDTSNVTSMHRMFYYCKYLTSLDLSSFDTSNVTDMSYMFALTFGDYYSYYDNRKLETIFVSDLWNTDAVTNSKSYNMFYDCTILKGGDGTVYDKKHVDKEYACIDGKDGKPGYLTYKEYKCPGSYVKGVSLTLAQRIGVIFYVNMKDQVKKAVLAGYPGEITVTDLTPIESGDYKGCVKLVYPVNATEARRKITLRLYDKDGNQLPLYNSGLRRLPDNTVQFSVQDYLEQAPTYYPNNEKAKELADALKNYCNAASNYFCGKDYTVKGIGDITADSFKGFKSPLNGLKIALVLNSQTELRVYGIGTTENYTARVNQLPDLIYDAEGGYHKITGIRPDQLVYGDEYRINGKYVAVSPLTYGYYVMKNSDDEALKTVVRALFVYAKTALDY